MRTIRIVIEDEQFQIDTVISKLVSMGISFNIQIPEISTYPIGFSLRSKPRHLGSKKLVTLRSCADDSSLFHSLLAMTSRTNMTREQTRSAANDATKRKELERKLIQGAVHYRITPQGLMKLALHDEAAENASGTQSGEIA